MTPEKVIELAKQAGFKADGAVIRTIHSSGAWVSINGELQRFAELARAEALEEVADMTTACDRRATPQGIAAAIRRMK